MEAPKNQGTANLIYLEQILQESPIPPAQSQITEPLAAQSQITEPLAEEPLVRFGAEIISPQNETLKSSPRTRLKQSITETSYSNLKPDTTSNTKKILYRKGRSVSTQSISTEAKLSSEQKQKAKVALLNPIPITPPSKLPQNRTPRFNDLLGKTKRSAESISEKDHIKHKKEKYTKHINDVVISSLEFEWKKVKKRPPVTAEKLDNIVHEICREQIFALSQSIKTCGYSKLYLQASKSAAHILDSIQNSPLILKNISSRLKVFYCTVDEWKFKDTQWSENLLQFLKILTEINTLKDGIFWSALSEFREKENEKIVSIMLRAFGDSPAEIESVIDLIETWSRSSESIRINAYKIPSTPKACLKLDDHIKKACTEIRLAEKTPFIKHVIPLEPEDVQLMLQIPLGEIKRCILPDGLVLINSIIINDDVFFQRGNKEFPSETYFWRSLLEKIYKELKIKMTREEILNQIQIYRLKTEHKFKEDHPEMEVPTDEEFEKMPWRPILSLITKTAWLRGDSYFKEFSTPIALYPYTLEATKGISECSVTIHSIQHFKITHTKYYRVSYAHSQDPILQAEIPISWSIENNHGNWKGGLQILDPKTINKIIETVKKEIEKSKKEDHTKILSQVLIQTCRKFNVEPLLNPEMFKFNFSKDISESDKWHILKTLSNQTLIELKL